MKLKLTNLLETEVHGRRQKSGRMALGGRFAAAGVRLGASAERQVVHVVRVGLVQPVGRLI